MPLACAEQDAQQDKQTDNQDDEAADDKQDDRSVYHKILFSLIRSLRVGIIFRLVWLLWLAIVLAVAFDCTKEQPEENTKADTHGRVPKCCTDGYPKNHAIHHKACNDIVFCAVFHGLFLSALRLSFLLLGFIV
jgi:hypothetical protein